MNNAADSEGELLEVRTNDRTAIAFAAVLALGDNGVSVFDWIAKKVRPDTEQARKDLEASVANTYNRALAKHRDFETANRIKRPVHLVALRAAHLRRLDPSKRTGAVLTTPLLEVGLPAENSP